MRTQADWRMLLALQPPEPPPDLVGALSQGLQLGDYFRKRGQENQLQELMRGSIDPQTGEIDTGKALGALMQFDPATGIKLMQQDRLERMQAQGLQAAMSGDYTPEERDILKGYSVAGKIGEGIAKIGELRYGRSVANENRAQERLPGIVLTSKGPVEVTNTRENWERPAPASAPAPVGAPAPVTGQLIGSERPPVAGAPGHDLSLEMIRNLSPADRAKLYSQLTPGQVAEINLALSTPGTVTLQTPYATPQRKKPVAQNPVNLPPGAIQRGLSPAQQQEIKIQEERRAEDRRIAEEERANQEARERAVLDYNRGAPERAFNKENQLRDEFNTSLKEYNIMRDKYGAMLEAMRVAKTATDGKTKGASDITLIFSFMKVLDPTSVVREGEYATAANAGGVPDRILNYYNKVLQGDQLPDSVREAIMNQGDLLYKRAKQNAVMNQKRYSTLARQSGVNPDNVVYDIEGKSLPSVADFQKQLDKEMETARINAAKPQPAPGNKPENQSGERKFNHPNQDEIDKIKAQIRSGR